MSGYSAFAVYYDGLTSNISYGERAAYFDLLLRKNGVCGERPLLLDLACGTGSLSVELAKLGYDVIGVDGSAEMLSVAMQKAPVAEGGEANPLFLCQNMAELNLFGTIGAAVCALDSLNHILNEKTLGKVLARVSLFLDPGGIFIFDVNTPYKHREILGNNTFVYENEQVYCVWQNSYHPKEETVGISLDFFVRQGGRQGSEHYLRETERFAERAYGHETLCALVEAAGLELVAMYQGDSLNPVGEDTQRAVYVTQKRRAPMEIAEHSALKKPNTTADKRRR